MGFFGMGNSNIGFKLPLGGHNLASKSAGGLHKTDLEAVQ